MAGGEIQTDGIAVQRVVKRNRPRSVFWNARLPHQEICQEERKDHTERQRRYSERTIPE
jgi:hypothetical protein